MSSKKTVRSSATQRGEDPLARYAPKRGGPKRGYPDLHDHLHRLAREGLLVVVDEPINKDTEMHPLVRWQFRGGIEEKNREAFLFTQPVDGTGRRFDRSEEHTSELQSPCNLVCRLLLEKKKA